ncbi:MAG TPA: energy transducer TonB [Woeseiaceae bacterium]|nr:energy transducer TonB [Woeseiaceae bacterium]
MMLLRLPLTFLLGAVLTIGMFWVLWSLISQPINVDEMLEATRIEFSRMRRDTQAATKRDERVEREPPPPAPEMPRMSFSAANVGGSAVTLTPTIDTAGALGNMNLSAGADTDVIPLVRIAPEYPPRALRRGIEGWVQVQFTITPTGAVTDATVVAADPPGLFDEAAIRSILRWRYNPKIEGGVAVERVGVQTVIRFVLEE